MLFLIAHLDAPRVGVSVVIREMLVATATREKDSGLLVDLFSPTLG